MRPAGASVPGKFFFLLRRFFFFFGLEVGDAVVPASASISSSLGGGPLRFNIGRFKSSDCREFRGKTMLEEGDSGKWESLLWAMGSLS